MIQVLLTGMGAGAAAALLFASVTSGAALSVVLFYLAPLPIMIVALGWSHWAALAAAAAAAGLLASTFGTFFLGLFLTSVGAPAWWLGYLALLGRPAGAKSAPPVPVTPAPRVGPEQAQMEWYPPGRLVLWAALIGAAVTAGALTTFGSDEAAIRHTLRDVLGQVLHPLSASPADVPQTVPGADAQGDTAGPPVAAPDDDADHVVDLLAALLPPSAAVIAALTQVANLWLAALIVRLSGRLRCPWPDLTALSLPPLAAGLYGAALCAVMVPGLTGLIAGLFAASLTIAFAMVGLSVMHAGTRGMHGRAAALWGAYGCIFLLIWPLGVMTLVGVAETLFDLRGRFFRRGPPAAQGP